MASRIYVGNLPSSIAERDLEEEFIRFGTLRSVWVARKPPGFAFVEYEDPRDADDAVRKLDGFKGWRVEHSKNRGPRWQDGPRDGPRDSYRSRDRSPPPRRRSPTPDRYRRRSPSYERPRRRSPSYEPVRRRSPSYDRDRSRSPLRGRSLSRSPLD
ncbi:g7943 [Coccomyxa elongata]